MLKIFQKWLFIVMLSVFLIMIYSLNLIHGKYIKEINRDRINIQITEIKDHLSAIPPDMEDLDKLFSQSISEKHAFIILKDKTLFKSKHIELTKNDLSKINNYRLKKLHLIKLSSGYYYIWVGSQSDYYIYGLISLKYIYNLQTIKDIILTSFVMFLFAFILISFLINNLVIKNIFKINKSLLRITNGDLDEKINVNATKEFKALSLGINQTVDALKAAIKNEKNRLEYELKLANQVQQSALPQKIHSNDVFKICPFIKPAEEIGGDFYDYFIFNNKLIFLIADVSGKSIPAALFMMKTKMVLKSLSEMGYSPEKVIKLANKKLCEQNYDDFFVTVFYCSFDLNSGELKYVNAGHNAPLIMQNNGEYRFLDTKPSIVLGINPNAVYESYKIQLKKSDKILLYTDGVTEALNNQNQFFGDNRLIDCINTNSEKAIDEQITNITDSLKDFSNNVKQSDDITLLGFEYRNSNTNNLILEARVENLTILKEWLDKKMVSFSDELKTKIELTSEEIFVNIANYAYPNERDIVILKMETDSTVKLTFEDYGIEYNPLDEETPDTNLSADDRIKGGFGIFIVKNNAVNLDYKRQDNKNILTVELAKDA